MIPAKFVIRTRAGQKVRDFAWQVDFLPTLGSTINTYEAFDDPADALGGEATYHFCDVTKIDWELTDGRVMMGMETGPDQ